MSKKEMSLWNEHEKTLSRIGFTWEMKEKEGQFLIHAIPAELNEATVLPCVDKIIESLEMGTLDKGEIAHTVLAQTAFAGSISFQLQTDLETQKEFLKRLFQENDHTYTPKGKKIIAELSNESIFQLF